MQNLTPLLRHLVNQSVALLGKVIERELGKNVFLKIEKLRVQMTGLRDRNDEFSFKELQKVYAQLKKSSPLERHAIAHSFTLMLELMNTCENAYRSHRLELNPNKITLQKDQPAAIVYVLTAHPTEARSPLNIAIFHQIQSLLIQILARMEKQESLDFLAIEENDLLHLIEIAWRTDIVRRRAPKVKDEAEHIYSLLFRDEILMSLLEFSERYTPIYIRSWVGGDKDGHPGVDEQVLLESLTLSRQMLLKMALKLLEKVKQSLKLFSSPNLIKQISKAHRHIRQLKNISSADGQKVQRLRETLHRFRQEYESELGAQHPDLRRLRQIFHIFPGLVVPLELRESSDVLMAPSSGKKIAIERMLATLATISKGGDPRWYARGFIISMCESIEHIRQAGEKQRAAFGDYRLPIIPLFEKTEALVDAPHIVKEMTEDAKIRHAVEKFWDGRIEMMVGYSDSSKEAGVLSSRLAIAEALPKLEKVCQRAKITPLFFHGSGGSIDRGGGTIEDQTSWWPKSALRYYKGTVQGEMVERSLATPAIARSQLEKIYLSACRGLKTNHAFTRDPVLDKFAQNISASYRQQITSELFLWMVESATPYSFLNILKIGSRPSKRSTQLSVAGLRAIPWIMCWTQTRVLFPTWWGVGHAWESLSAGDKKSLRKSFQTDAVFTSYVKALGFTLAKIEIEVFRMYLFKSNLTSQQQSEIFKAFQDEFEKTKKCFHEITDEKELLWYRPWLAESIRLRSPMIHPLNLLQIIAMEEKDLALLRVTVTGVSSGMQTTG
ncbi:phosphoenolpyruvate carboxylase [Bdellovibrio sp. HCB2-146]|uniref:phosphoenolpyruvate carboxylase n=1 Tax=Bdellovibrio sp. HCB2-146 TaxID=3394362 RepID=UPI0039BCAB5B